MAVHPPSAHRSFRTSSLPRGHMLSLSSGARTSRPLLTALLYAVPRGNVRFDNSTLCALGDPPSSRAGPGHVTLRLVHFQASQRNHNTVLTPTSSAYRSARPELYNPRMAAPHPANELGMLRCSCVKVQSANSCAHRRLNSTSHSDRYSFSLQRYDLHF
jgi:hypothetical protein